VQILFAQLPANRRKSPTWSSLDTAGIEVSLAATDFLPPMQMIVILPMGHKQSIQIHCQLEFFF
jgi:hypothetical protein